MDKRQECGYGWGGTFYESDLNLLLSFSSRVWYTEPYGCSGVRNVYDGEALCTGVGGNASQLMGVDEKISVSDMEQLLDCKFRHFNPNQDDTIEAGDSIATVSYTHLFLCSDGQVKLLDFGASRYATVQHSKSPVSYTHLDTA